MPALLIRFKFDVNKRQKQQYQKLKRKRLYNKSVANKTDCYFTIESTTIMTTSVTH